MRSPLSHPLPLLLLALTALAAVSAPAFADEPPADAPPPPIDVRVEGDRAAPPRSPRAPEVASYVVRGDDLKRPGAAAVDVLAASPGVEGARTGAGSDLATLSIRGAPSAQLPVYLAGVRLNDDVTGGADLSTVPLFALDRVEIFRGNAPPGAARLGIGGAVYFEPRLPRGTHAGATLGAGSFGELSISAFGSIGDDRAGALFSLSRQSATNDYSYPFDAGTPDFPGDDRVVKRENGDAATHDAWALGRVALPSGGRLVMFANAFHREQGLVPFAFDTLRASSRAVRSATMRELAAASARLSCSGRSAQAEAGAERCAIELGSSAVVSRRAIRDPDRALGLGAALAQTSAQRWEESARLRVRIGERVQVGAAAFVGVDRIGVDLDGAPQTRADRLSITASADARWDIADRVSLFALGAGECHTPFGGGASDGRVCAAGGPAGRAGLRIAAPLGIELVASAGSYVRVPTLGELYGLSGTVRGNVRLVPERGYTAEIGARRSFLSPGGDVRGYVDVTGFARFAENLIAYRLTSQRTIAPFNLADARVLGVEALAGVDVARHVRSEVSLTLQDPRDVTPERHPINDLLPYHAPLTLSSLVEVYADASRAVPFVGRVSAGAHLRYRSPRVADPAAVYHLADVTRLDLEGSASLLAGRIVARLAVTNLLDSADQDLLGYALPGRAFHGSLEATW